MWRGNLAVDHENPSPPAAEGSGPSVMEPIRNSMAVQKFRACRWRRPAEGDTPECCGHRDVLPLTGTHGFDPEAWCEECTFFKLRRTPRKPPSPFIR
jgi:hypothetical protein